MSDRRRVRLGDVIDIKHGYAFKGDYFCSEPPGDFLLTPGNFAIGGGFQWGKQKFYRGGPVPSDYVLNAGDILITMTDLSKQADTLGYSAKVPESKYRILHNQRLGRIFAKNNEIKLEYVHWLLRTDDYRNEILASCSGSTVKHTSPKKILAFEFDLPAPDEQVKISTILDDIDDKIELNRRMNETLEAMARSLFKDWFVDFGPTRAKMEGRPPYLAPEIWNLFPDRLDDEGKPEGWTNDPLTEFFSIVGGGTPMTSVSEYWNGNIPWFSVTDTPPRADVFVVSTEKTITNDGLASSSARLVPRGTTIISARGTVGNLAIVGRDMTFNQSCYGLRAIEPVGDYATYLIAQNMVSTLQARAHGSVFSTITRKTFEALKQQKATPQLLQAFEMLVSPFFDRILANVSESETLSITRDLLLPKLMSGEVRVANTEQTEQEAT
ncbi:MAG: restriction endonuclease subunit S [Rhodospirillales bacterium]